MEVCMKMEKYEKPSLTVKKYDIEDFITSSSSQSGGGEDEGGWLPGWYTIRKEQKFFS